MKHLALALLVASLFATGAAFAAQDDDNATNTQTAAVGGNQTGGSGEEDCN